VSRTPARRALAAGLATAVAYLCLAALSGHLSPLARRPLLDGYGPPVAYRWVSPPPELADANVPPTPGTFTVRFGEHGSRPDVLTTDDAQVTVILVAGTFPAAPGQESVQVRVTPLDAAEVGSPEDPLRIVGNVVRLEATYEPSGRPVGSIEQPLEVILVYPLPPDVHAATHTLVSSPAGTTWTASDGTDSPGIQQTEGPVDALGYVAAAGDVSSGPSSPAPSPGTSGNTTLGIALIVGAVCAALVGLGLLLRGREPRRRR
jgi:hypothetical protein